jgi:hypothetical protein
MTNSTLLSAPPSNTMQNVIRLYALGDTLRIVYLPEKRSVHWQPKPAERIAFRSDSNAGIAKLPESLRRSRRKLEEYVICNDFELFLTVTGDGGKVNRYDLDWVSQKLTRWLRDYRTKHGLDLKYIVIPEHHADDAWHAHILLSGLPKEHLTQLTGICPEDAGEFGSEPHYWDACADKFGGAVALTVFDAERLVGYLTKYWRDENERQHDTLGKRLYYPSHGLKHRELIGEWHCFFNTQEAENAVLPAGFDYQDDYFAMQECDVGCLGVVLQIMEHYCDLGLAVCAFWGVGEETTE